MGLTAMYEALLEQMNLTQPSIDSHDRIKVLNMHSPQGVEKEFIIFLPKADNTQQYLKQLEEKGVNAFEVRRNTASAKNTLGSVLMMHAWRKDMVSIGPHGSKRLEKALQIANVTKDDLPQKCITGELKKMVWIRHLENHKMFAPLFDSEIDDDEKLHRSFHKKKSKLCSIDGARAVEMKKVKMIFEDCYFHSRHFIKVRSFRCYILILILILILR